MNAYHGTFWSYFVGFVGSLLFTFAAYLAVTRHLAFGTTLLVAVIVLALLQLVVQLVLFLHLGRRASPWNRAAFVFAAIVVSIILAGSLWIMFNLNARMMPSMDQMMQYMQSQDAM